MIDNFKYIRDRISNLTFRGFLRVSLMGLRGVFLTMRLGKLIFIGRHSTIIRPSNLHLEGTLKVDDFSLIQCDSKSPIRFGRDVSFGSFCQLRPSSLYGGVLGAGCDIGSGTSFGPYCYIGCAGDITIGRNTLFGPRVSIIAENHVIPPIPDSIKFAGVNNLGVSIGSDCWIGANVVILDGSSIGEGCVVAAGAVVKGLFPPFCIIGGVPAKILRYRNESTND